MPSGMCSRGAWRRMEETNKGWCFGCLPRRLAPRGENPSPTRGFFSGFLPGSETPRDRLEVSVSAFAAVEKRETAMEEGGF